MEMLPGIAAMIFVFESKACFVEPHILSYFDRLWIVCGINNPVLRGLSLTHHYIMKVSKCCAPNSDATSVF